MYLISSITPTNPERDPVIMRRRALLATALGLGSAAVLPSWAEAAAHTTDGDHTRRGSATWDESFTGARHELDYLARHYVTEPGMTKHSDVRDSGLWLYAQANELAKGAPLGKKNEARRLCAEAAMFAAGCYVDFGHMTAATDLYHRAHQAAGPENPDLRVFIGCQANWVPMYSAEWGKVLRRSESAVAAAERHGGPALLMSYMHRAHAHSMLGNPGAARADLETAQNNIRRVPAARGPQHALTYSATKVWFSSANAYAALGDADRHADAQAHALADTGLGWMDRQLMQIGEAALNPDPEMAAHRIRFQLLRIPADGFAHCVKADAEKALARLKVKQLTGSRDKKAGSEVRMLGSYLRTVQVA